MSDQPHPPLAGATPRALAPHGPALGRDRARRRPPALPTLLALALVLLAAAAGVRPAAAAPALPAGSYQQSCEKVRLSDDGKTLSAFCRNRDGAWHPTTLADLADCTDDVANRGGDLRCNKGGPPPAGSYGATCRDIWRDHAVLHAACDDGTGKFLPNDLADLDACAATVVNVHGHLTCPKGGKPPAGTYAASCWDVTLASGALQATCRGRDGTPRTARIASLADCHGTPRNVDGYLTCDRGTADAPQGSYRDTCIDIVRTADTLDARCENAHGDLVPAHLANARPCTRIANHDGHLACVEHP